MALDQLSHQALHGRVVHHVAALQLQPGLRLAGDGGLETLALVLHDPRHADQRALGEEAPGDGLAQGAAAAGDDGDARHAHSAPAGASMMAERWISS